MKIDRKELIKNFEEFAQSGSGIIIGHPGVGKTVLLKQYTEKLLNKKVPCFYLPIDKLGIETELELKAFLKINNDFITNIKSNKRNYQGKGILVIDSFDAARSEKAQLFFLGLIWDVINKLGDSWNVIVSVRTYDAKKSEKLHELFSKDNSTTPKEYRINEVPCRHFFVPPLSNDEVESVLPTVPGLAQVYENASSELKVLLKIPFNIWLMEKLLSVNANMQQLSRINSEVQLLGLFWQNRVKNSGQRMDKEAILARITQEMVRSKTLSVRRSEVYFTGEHQAWDELFSSEIINETSTSFQRVSFYHNILFDYAVSVLLIDDIPQKVEEFILADAARPVFLRPSLDYYFTRLWNDAPKIFWAVFWHILPNQNPNLRLFSRLIPTGTIAKELKNIEELYPLLDVLTKKEEIAYKAVLYLLQSLRTLNVGNEELWTKVIRKISDDINDMFVWDLTLMANSLYDFGKSKDLQSIIEISGETSRNLFKWMWQSRSNVYIDRLGSAWITPMVAKTFGTNPIESKELLSHVLELVNEKNFSIQFLFRLTSEIENIWPYDPEFTMFIYLTIFNYMETSEEKTGFGTPVLPMSSTRRQDYQMCQYELTQKFPKFLNDFPLFAIKTAILCINSIVIEDHIVEYLKDGVSLKDCSEEFDFLGKKTIYLKDMSYIWDLRDFDDEPMKMANPLFNYIEKLASDNKLNEIDSVLELFRDDVQVAFFWRKLLQIASKYPSIFSSKLFELCSALPVLKHSETSYEAGEFIKSAIKYFSTTQIEKIEKVIISLPSEEKGKKKEYLEDLRNRLLIQIPLDMLVTQEGKDIINNIPQKENIKNEPHASLTQGTWDKDVFGDKIDLGNKKEEDKIKKYIETLDKFSSENINGIPSIEIVRQYLPTVKKLYAAVMSIKGEDNLRVIWTALGEATEKMSRNINKLKPKEIDLLSDVLLDCSISEFPKPHPEHDKNYDSAGWSPSPRNEAAQGLPWLAIKRPDRKILTAIKILINDPVPSVRFLIVRELFRTSESAPNFFWKVSKQIAVNEENHVVLDGLLFSLSRVVGKNEKKSIAILIQVTQKALKAETKTSHFVESFISIIVWLAIVRKNKWAIVTLNSILEQPFFYSTQLSRATFEVLKYIEPKQLQLRMEIVDNAIEWLKRAIETVNKEFENIQSNPNKTDEKVQEKIRNLYHVIDEIVTRLYFASDVNKKVRKGIEISDQDRKEFYFKTKPLLEYLIKYSSRKKYGVLLAPTAHHFIELLNGVLKYDPKGALHLATQVVIASKPYGYNVDSLAITEIVNMVESILANYRNEVQDGQSLTDLLNLLDVFAEAGWPEALRLVWRLDEIFR